MGLWLLVWAALLTAVPARAVSAEDAALERLHAEDAAVRERACGELAHAHERGPRVYPALFLAMDRDISDRVRLAAAKAVITFTGNDALKRAQGFFQSEPGAQSRIELALTLSTEPAHMDDTGVTDLISALLADDPSPMVRRAAAIGLSRRGDTRGLPAVRRAAENDADKSARDAALQAVRVLTSRFPSWPKNRPHQVKPPKPDAVKGKDSCPEPWGWCECNGPIKRSPQCLNRSDCRVEVDTVIQLGMPCTWNGVPIGVPN